MTPFKPFREIRVRPFLQIISMKYLSLLTIAVISLVSCGKTDDTRTPVTPTPPPTPTVDSFTVTVSNGYGSGKYKTGDTVHIFSTAVTDAQVFDKWIGTDVALLDGFEEWHTWFIMPARNVSFTGGIKAITPFTLQLVTIRGRDRNKPVYYYFPAGHKGFVYLLHGSGGSALNTVNNYEFKQLCKDLVNDGLGVIVTESEESTTGVDADGDGKIRWSYAPYDTTTNVDFANIRILTDTLYNRGLTVRGKPRYSVGMSNGGAFSAALSSIYKFTAGVSYCAPGGTPISLITTTPFQFCMARFDNHENVGQQGNADALTNSNTLISRGICSKYYITQRSPLYPERFARKGDISLAKSAAIFNELKAKGYLDAKNYFIGFSGPFVTAFQANPASFPEINSLTILQRLTVVEQIDLAITDHQMYSDYNRATLRFLNRQCL